jgi:xylulokinase
MYLGIDVGTSGVKATLIEDPHRVVASAQAALGVSRPQPGWCEQDPADWIRATEVAIDELRGSHAASVAAVRGIGLTGQMHGATLLDARDRPLRPCILWSDTRAHREAARLDRDPQFRELTGNIVFAGFTAPKLLWVKQREPANFAALRRVLLPKDYLRLWLTGEHVSDMSDAAGTSWLATGARIWSAPLLAATGLGVEHMPTLVEGTEVSGVLRPAIADQWGMRRNIVVAGGAGDNAATACGIGAVSGGSAFVSLGTSGVLFAANDRYAPNAASAVHAFCHALPATWHQMGVILAATDCLNWLSGLAGKPADVLTAGLGDTLRPPGSVTFLPYLAGERTPHNDASLRGVFTGLGHESGLDALTQAVLEGVAFALRDSLEALQAVGTRIGRVTAVGGGARSRYWLQAIATALGVPVDRPAASHLGAAFGAARLALVAAESADPLAVCAAPAAADTIEPCMELADQYAARYGRFRELLGAARPARHTRPVEDDCRAK